jgi:hypothetical protein
MMDNSTESLFIKYSTLFQQLDLDITENWPSAKVVKKAFNKKIKLLHPDKGGQNDEVINIVCSLFFPSL